MAKRSGGKRRSRRCKIPFPRYSQLYYGSARGVHEWNHSIVHEHNAEKLVTALLYPVKVNNSRMVKLPVSVDYEDAVDATGWVADVKTCDWFPHGSRYTEVGNLAGAGRPLTNRYTIVTSRLQEKAPINECILSKFAITTRGNVLVLRHGRHHSVHVTNLHSAERQFVDILVHQ